MMNRFFVLLALTLALFGCGGGGGGGDDRSPTGTVNAVADWTHFGSGISGSSMRWTLYNLDESVIRSVAVNRDQPGEQLVAITDVPRGLCRIRVELFAGRDLAGSLVGEIDDIFEIKSTSSYIACVGTQPSTIKVIPETSTMKAGQGRQFYAMARNSASKPTFIAPESISWQAFGGVATVNDFGFVQAASPGSGTVVANHDSSGLLGGATLTVQNAAVTTGKWTVLVYMNAASNLYEASDLNMNQMEQVAGNPDVRFVVQWKQSTSVFANSSFNGTRRYLVKPDGNSHQVQSELVQNMGLNVDMGKKETLHDFIAWAKTYYPAERYCLIIWNHGNGWRRGPDGAFPTRGVSYDDETGSSIDTWELGAALGDNHFDILAWDASLMQMLEVATEVEEHADYVVGSEESPPGEGYPYHLVFAQFRDNPNASTLALAKNFVDGPFGFAYKGIPLLTQSVIDTTQLPALRTQIDALATALMNHVGEPGYANLIQTVRDSAKSYSPTFGRVYRDLWDICDRLQTASDINDIEEACTSVKTALANAIKWERHGVYINSAGNHGLSIDFSKGTQFVGQVKSDYANLRFGSQTLWDEWLAVAP